MYQMMSVWGGVNPLKWVENPWKWTFHPWKLLLLGFGLGPVWFLGCWIVRTVDVCVACHGVHAVALGLWRFGLGAVSPQVMYLLYRWIFLSIFLVLVCAGPDGLSPGNAIIWMPQWGFSKPPWIHPLVFQWGHGCVVGTVCIVRRHGYLL